MKKITTYLASIICLMVLVAGCSDNSSGPDPEPKPEPELNSFGFYQNDNPDQLFMDYDIQQISGSEITIALPEQADKSSLVAQFTATEGTEVTVNGETQVSGETENDFTAPVEYIVTNDEQSKSYTITVNDLAEAEWSQLATFMQDSVREISMAINPESSIPYIGYVSDRDEFDNRKLNAVKYDGSWSRLGSKDFSSARARSVNMSFGSDGTPYLAFGDDSKDPTQGSIVSYESSSWDYVGGMPFSGEEADASRVAVTDDGTVYGFYTDEDRNVQARSSQGSSWNPLPITGRSGAAIDLDAEASGNDAYVAVLDFGNSQSISVYKYDGSSWETLADHMKEDPDNFVYYYNVALSVADNGTVYVAYAEDQGSGTDLKLKVKKYNPSSGDWSRIGSLIGTSELRSFDIAVDNYGTPILLYKNDTENPTAIMLDEDTNNWTQPVVLNNVEADGINLEFAPNGVGFASYTVDNRLHLDQYASPDNN